MSNSTSSLGKDCISALIIFLAGILLGAVGYMLFIPELLESAFKGESALSSLNAAVAARRDVDPSSRDLFYFQWIGSTLATRVGMLWFAAVALWLGWRQRQRFTNMLHTFFTARDTPLNLAVFRIVMFGMLFLFLDKDNLAYYSTLPDDLLFPPVGLGPVLAALPRSPEIAESAIWLLQISCLLAMFGAFTRVTTIVGTVLALYVLGLPQMFGKVNHAHHMIWFTALLAASPCGAALSIDSLARRYIRGDRGRPARAIAYALPLRFTWILLGLIYFFPGFWKLWTGGVEWVLSDHLRNQMYHLWSTHENRYALEFLTESKPLLILGGIGTIAFEVFFICFIFSRRMRIVALIGGIAFHNAVGFTLRIAFVTLQWSFVSLVDWQWIRDKLAGPESSGSSRERSAPSPIPTAVVGVCILIPTLWFGFRGESDGWPFACYPRFAYPIFKPERAVIEFDTVDADGEVKTNRLEKLRSNFRTARWIGLVRRVLATEDEQLRNQRLAALGRLALDDVGDGTALRFYRTTYSTIPEDWGNDPTDRVLLAEIRVHPTDQNEDAP